MTNIIIKNFQRKIPVNRNRIKAIAIRALSSEQFRKSGEITICFVNDQKIRQLNKKYLGRDNPTDVLAFDMTLPQDTDALFADIIVSADTAIRNAGIFKTAPLYELYLYIAHGVLHLSGYDDKTALGRRKMDKRAREICQSIGPKP